MLRKNKKLRKDRKHRYNPNCYSTYVKALAGNYIGTFQYLLYGTLPIYLFPDGERAANIDELRNGSNSLEELFKRTVGNKKQ